MGKNLAAGRMYRSNEPEQQNHTTKAIVSEEPKDKEGRDEMR
jgi:hypothetical protein